MQKLAEVSIRRPVFATMLVLSLVVVGATSYFRLGVDRFPSVDLPTVRISTSLPGASPSEVESLITHRIEEAVNSIEGIQELRSISWPGLSYIFVTFNLKRDIDSATQDVRDRLASVVRALPREVDPPIISKVDNDLSPVLVVSMSGDRALRELSELAEKTVKVQLERVPGVGEVEMTGALNRSINVWIDADRLAAYRLPITAVREAIARQNANVPGGNVTGELREATLRTIARVQRPKDFNNLVIATVNGAPIRVRDLGLAEDGTREQRTLARFNGRPNVSLGIIRQSGANSIAVIEAAKQKLDELQKQLPPDIRLEITRDHSRYIYEAQSEINRHLLLGSILASLVVLLFMRDWRSTIIAAIAIPISVIATFGMMWALNFTLNSVTMLALVLMVGIVIDDAIIVIENIFRFMEEKRLGPFEAARAATAEIGMAVMATTFSLVVIFVPVSFMSSIAGRFLFQFGITAAVAVLISLLVSFTLTPMMSARLLKMPAGDGHGAARSRRGFYAWIDRGYTAALTFSMRHRVAVGLLMLAVMWSAVPLYKQVRQEYTPTNTDEGEFEVNIVARDGTSITAMDATAQRIETELRDIRGVHSIFSGIGSGAFGVHYARFFVRLTPHAERTFTWPRFLRNPADAFKGNFTQRDVVQEVRKRMRKFTDLRASVRSGSSFSLGGANYEIDFALMGPDLTQLLAYAEILRQKAPELGIVDADVTLKFDKPELRVEIDRDRAAALDVDAEDLASALRIMVGGEMRVTRFHDNTTSEDYDVQLRLEEADRRDPESILRLHIPTRHGGLVRLDNLVKLTPALTAARIDRLDRRRQVSLRGAVGPGYALADRLAALQKAADELNLPSGYTTQVSGRGKELERTFREFIWAFALSVVFMYMILAAQYESLVHPLTILLSLPLSLPFALLSLWATGNTLNLYSALGLLVLFGVVKKNAILQIDHMNQLRAKGMERFDAILQANRDRLRPILMTTLALVAGMLPLALGTGPGAEERRAVAVVVVGGQSLCLLLTLLITPVAYSLFDDLALWFRSRFWSPSKTD